VAGGVEVLAPQPPNTATASAGYFCFCMMVPLPA